MIRFYFHPTPNPAKVALFLEETGLPYEVVPVDTAYCLEAAAAGPAKPSSRQLGDWFWNETATGAAVHAVREMHLTSDDERLKLIAGNFIVPAARVRMLG